MARMVEYVAYITKPDGGEKKSGGVLTNVSPYITAEEIKSFLMKTHEGFKGVPPDKIKIEVKGQELSPRALSELRNVMSGVPSEVKPISTPAK
jgi:hypothetical protein